MNIILIFFILSLIYYFGFAFPFRGVPFNPKRHGNPPITPAWALESLSQPEEVVQHAAGERIQSCALDDHNG